MSAAKKSVQFFYDISCPFAYLASTRIQHETERAGGFVQYCPVLLGGIYEQTRAPQGKAGSASDVMSPAKKRVSVLDLARNLRRFDVALSWPDKHPQSTVKALRYLLAAKEGAERAQLTAAYYKLYWVDNADVSSDAVLRDTVRRVLGRSLETGDAEKQQLRENTKRYVELGGFGVPGFLVGERLFWGADRIHFAVGALNDTAVPLPRARPFWDRKQRTVTFYFDFASPWAFLASTQVERIARESHARLEMVPVLVGALFKMVGTPNVPMLAMPDNKREWSTRDMADWCKYWGVQLRWPDKFPIRSVLPLRVALVEPRTIPVIYRAAWTSNRDVSDAAQLAEVLTSEGFAAQRLIAQANEPKIKEQLKKNTSRAVAAGACGVPSFQVDGGEIVWGQDRLDVVSDMLCGFDQRCSMRPRL